MTLQEFSMLDKPRQIEAFWEAPLVGVISEDEFLIECRRIDNFYVECKIQEGYYTHLRLL